MGFVGNISVRGGQANHYANPTRQEDKTALSLYHVNLALPSHSLRSHWSDAYNNGTVRNCGLITGTIIVYMIR